MTGLMTGEKSRRLTISFDPDDISGMQQHRDWLTKMIEEAIRQQAADLGQIMALHGKTTPDRLEAFGPASERARSIADAFASVTDKDRAQLRAYDRKRTG